MSQISDILSKFQAIPEMSHGLSRRVARRGASRNQVALDQHQQRVNEVQANNVRALGEMLSLSSESSMMGSLNDFAQSALASLFGGAKSTAETVSAPLTTELQSTMGMGENLLRRGSTGPEVRTLQKNLKDRGYNIEVDGKFGPKTEKALRDFQAEQKLDGKPIAVDGILGPETSTALSNTKTEDDDQSGASDSARAQKATAEVSSKETKSVESKTHGSSSRAEGRKGGGASGGSGKSGPSPSGGSAGRAASRSGAE